MDVFHDHLLRARATGGVFAKSVARPPWGLRLAGIIQLAVHVVEQGSVWVWFDDPDAAVELRAGDIALLRGGADHFIGHQPGAEFDDHDEFAEHHSADRVDDPDAAVFLCGAYQFAGEIGPAFLNSLPQIVTLTATTEPTLHCTLSALSGELDVDTPGRQPILDRLLDAVLVLALRAALRQSVATPGWFHAVEDHRLNAVLQAVHNDPAHAWTVQKLALIAGMSRATFTRIFQRVVGQTPMQYVTEWRMTLAREQLIGGDATLAQIATSVGYGSPYAFAAAFQHHHGQSPGRWRSSRVGHAPGIA